MSPTMEQMEQKLGSIQALIDERFSECPSSSDSNRASASGSSYKRKRKTLVSLQVQLLDLKKLVHEICVYIEYFLQNVVRAIHKSLDDEEQLDLDQL